MTPIKLPVTYSFFKKYTHHEELVEMMLKVKANGDERIYKQLSQSNESKESALRQYYEAFYLKPKIREKFPIRFKAIPQKIKDKLLIIPVLDTKSDNKEDNACPLQNVLREFDKNRKCVDDKREADERIMRASKLVGDDEEQMVEDDSEPLGSPDVNSTSKETHKSPNEKEIMNTELKTSSPQKALCPQEVNAASKSPCKKPKMATELEASSPRKDSKVCENNIEAKDTNNAPDSTDSKISTSAAAKPKSSTFNYKNLLRYKHCCPLTYEEFCKYCNVNLLVKDFCQKHNVDIKKERMILKRTYIEFYLAPERRKLPPLNKIQLIKNCPMEIQNKFFTIPPKIYLEEDQGDQEQQTIKGAKVVNEKEERAVIDVIINSNNEQQIIKCSAIETAECNKGTAQATGEVLSQPTSSCQSTNPLGTEKLNSSKSQNVDSINNNLSKPISSQQNQPAPDTQNINSKDSPDKGTFQKEINNQLIKPSNHTEKTPIIEQINTAKSSNGTSQTRTISIPNKTASSGPTTTNPEIENINTETSQTISKCPTLETSNANNKTPAETITTTNNISRQPQTNVAATPSLQPTTSTTPSASTIQIPISLEEFKKYSYYEELIEKLFKLKALDNQELFMKYKNSSEAFDLTLNNYYQAFYLKPFIRDLLPIRFKALPNFIKNRLMKIPEGVKNETPNDFRIEQLVEPEFGSEVLKEMELAKDDDVEKAAENQRIINEASPSPPSSPTNTTVITIKTEKDIETSDCGNKKKSQEVATAGKKRTIPEDMKSTSTKRQKTQPTSPDDHIENTEKIRKSHKDLLPYAHCCPVTFSEFRNYTNVTELFRNFCQKRYNSLNKLPFMLKRAHLLYYLAPENRNYKPLNKLKISPQCPQHLRKKMFEIPTHLYLKGEKCSGGTKLNVNDKSIKQEEQEQRKVLKEQRKENVNEEQHKNNKSNTSKDPIEILENRLLPPTSLTFIGNAKKDSNGESPQCLNNNCVFHFISLLDFTELTDILFLLPQPQEVALLKTIFKKFIYKLLTQQNFNVKLMINGRLICKLLKYQEICENCLKEIKLLMEKDAIMPSRKLQTESEHPLSNCIFYHISHMEFIDSTNISYLISEPQEISITKSHFKKLIYRLIKQQNSNENLVGSFTLWSTLLAYQDICEKCDNEIQMLIKQETSQSAKDLEEERISNDCHEQVNDGSHLNNERISEETSEVNNAVVVNTEGNDVNNERMELALENPMTQVEPSQQLIDKSSKTKSTESIKENSQHKQDCTQKSSVDLWKSLKTEKIFNKFRSKLLAKLKESDKSIDFCAETYKIFLQCNEIPLTQLLNDFCENNEDIVKRILSDQELCEALTRHYYTKYMTNTLFAEKYPVKIKENRNNEQQTSKKGEEEQRGGRKSIATTKKSLEQQENLPDETADNNDIEKAKRIFFRSVEKTNTLSYILRTSFGLKQKILQTILSLTFTEFLEITNIYEGYELYADEHIVECMYRYVFRTPLVWPTNLYINLKNLCEFLHSKNIRFNDYATMLKYISPKILHWSALLSCTNIIECVKIDYENRTGRTLNSQSISLKEECIVYYNRCWKQEKWLGQIPRVNEEFYREYVNGSREDVTMMDESGLQEICEQFNEAENDNELEEQASVPNFATEVTVEATNEMNTSTTEANQSLKEFNCIILPNTQQQIEMLPAEERVSNDPLNNNNTTSFNLDVSMATSENSDDVMSLGELIVPTIKTEPINNKLLNKLVFYEDESNNIQCKPIEDEIIDLDASRTEILDKQLPPSQMDFDEETHDIRLSNELITSGSSDNLINFGQRLPSSNETIESNKDSQPKQQFMGITSTQLPQLPDVTLRSSGEEEVEGIRDNNKEKGQQMKDDKDKQLGSLQSIMETSTALQSFMAFPEAQRFPSTFEDLQTFSGTEQQSQQQENKNHFTNKQNPIQENVFIPMVRIEMPQEGTSSIQPTIAAMKSLPLRRCMPKNVAKVKPLKNSDYVPQIQHNTRPLLTKPVHTTRSLNKEQTEIPKTQELSPVMIQTSSVETIESSQNSNVQIQQSPLGTHIFISQELNTNCSVFNNTSLLRIVDHNYQHATSTTSATQTPTTEEAIAENDQSKEKQDLLPELPATRRVTRKNSMLIASQQTEPNETPQIVPARRVTRRSSLCKDTNNKEYFVRNNKKS